MKRMIALLTLTVFLLSGCYSGDLISEEEPVPETPLSENGFSFKGVWFSYWDINELVCGRSEAEYRAFLLEKLTEISNCGFTDAVYHARAFCDALYFSELFPASAYIKTDGKPPGFDPLSVFSECAKQSGLRLHIWVNPYRVSSSADVEKLDKSSPAYKLYENDASALIVCKSGIYLDPADESCRNLIIGGIKELLEKYRPDGLQFDDYFYPPDPDFDNVKYKEYTEKGGMLSEADFNRENVSLLISRVYDCVKEYDGNAVLGVSPSAVKETNYNELFADVEKWCGEKGYVDYICPQIYFGLENETRPFEETAKKWASVSRDESVELFCGIASYKCGKTDENAGKGRNEWKEKSDVLSSQCAIIKGFEAFSGICVFSYSYSFGENMNYNSKKEITKLSYMLQ